MAGKFISLEGGEGAGKSTQARLLGAALEALGHEVVLSREPGGTPGAETIRSLLLDKEQDWTAEAEALLFAAARADHVAKLIRPALKRGAWVICDRYLDSSRAYQGGREGLTDTDILNLHQVGSAGLLPDLTVLLLADEADVAARLRARDGENSDRIGGRPQKYHRQVVARFCEFAAQDSARFCSIEASDTPEKVHGDIMQALAPLLSSQADRS